MRVEIDRRGMRQLLRDPALYRQMNEFAGRAATVARSIAPRGEGSDRRKGGSYARRIFYRVAREESTACAYYGSQDWKAWWVEFGSKHNKAHHVLQNAARLTNMRVSGVAVPGRRRLLP
jgi:hypothetical protein